MARPLLFRYSAYQLEQALIIYNGSFIILIVSCTNTTVTFSNPNFILSVAMSVYSSPSKFQVKRYEDLNIMLFPYIFYVKGQSLTLHIGNAWENVIFEALYLMIHTCNLFETWNE